MKKARVGQTVSVTIGGRTVKGIISFINPAPEFAVKKATQHLDDEDIRSFLVRVKLPADVYAGMTAEWSGSE